MLSNFLRKILSLLSFWSLNDLNSIKSRDEKILKIIKKKLNSIYFNKKYLKNTHNLFNKKILDLLKKRELTNFLRKNFIQKMFFVHNRLFILKELLELKKDKNWILYKKLIEEDNVGNPVRYFLYPKSSGNRINHVYHLSVLTKGFNINLKKLNNVFEFGGGYGCMARIFSKINKRTTFTCFDTSIVNLLQYYYLKQNNLDVGFSKKNKFRLISNIKKINTRYSNSLFIANWSLSETPINFRKKFIKSIKNSKLILISFQENFENINNLKYFKNLKKNLEKKFEIKIIKNEFYKGNFFKKQKHFFFIANKL
jgi:putative sugar O-methyltransferase